MFLIHFCLWNHTTRRTARLRMLVTLVSCFFLAPSTYAETSPKKVLDAIDGRRGLCVIVGSGAGDLAVALARASELVIFVQSPDAADVKNTRRIADDAGLLGTRIYIESGNLDRVHLADNLADAVVVSDEAVGDAAFDNSELLRVLRPGGKLIVGDEISTKPTPHGAGDWTHPYYGPDNNPLSEDQLARAPYLTQFLAKPYYGPMPAVTVASGGRLFKAFGHIAFKKREWPVVGKLIAMNAYNGTILWQRDLPPGWMIHRNTMIATPKVLYLADDDSCKLIDAATGEVQSQIVIPENAAEGRSWKWMALDKGVLYGLVGTPDPIDKVLLGTRTEAGWPWTGLGDNYARLKEDYPWGFGRTFVAIDGASGEVLWTQTESQLIDSRAVAMHSGRIYAYAHRKYVTAIDAASGDVVWKNADRQLIKAIGKHAPAQNYLNGFASQVYLKASEKVLFFAGPQRHLLVAASTEDGRYLWHHPDGNVQLLIRDGVVYSMGRLSASKKLDPLTGKVLAELPALRGNCTRVTGTCDSVFARGPEHGGTLRIDVADDSAHRLPAMRPACQDGVFISNGQLYWGPWMCDCSLSQVGVISLAPAGDFDFSMAATNESRLETGEGDVTSVESVSQTARDWPTYRADNRRTAQSAAAIDDSVDLAWEYQARQQCELTAPITVGELTFVSGADGVVRAFDNRAGTERWKAYTGGRVYFAPACEDGRLFVGSADGYVHAFEAASGRPLWRFRGAPIERKIPVYGELSSTWPVLSGVLAQDGVVYAAAGIASRDGTHVYALDSVTGNMKWQNNSAGRLMGDEVLSGVAVQGHLLLHDRKLYLAGGNVVSPGVFDIDTGACLNDLSDEWRKAPRGCELFLIGDEVRVFDRLIHAPREYVPSRYFAKYLLHAGGGSDVVIQGTHKRMMRLRLASDDDGDANLLWKRDGFVDTMGVAVAKNAVVAIGGVAGKHEDDPPTNMLAALDLSDGKTLFQHPLPGPPTRWGLAIDRAGRILVTTDDGRVLCYAATSPDR